MAKIKISDLSKQVGRENKDIIGALEALSIDNNGKRFVAGSNIDEEVAERVKRHLGVKQEQKLGIKEEKHMESRKEEEKKIEKKAEEKAEKMQEQPKKKISVVFNPQNSSQGGNNNRNSRPNNEKQRSNGGYQQNQSRTGNQGQRTNNHTSNQQQRTNQQGQHAQGGGQQNRYNEGRSVDNRQNRDNFRPSGNQGGRDGNRQSRPENRNSRPNNGNRTENRGNNNYRSDNRTGENRGTNGNRNDNRSNPNNQNNRNNEGRGGFGGNRSPQGGNTRRPDGRRNENSLDKKIEKARPEFIELKPERRQDRPDRDKQDKIDKFEERASKKGAKTVQELVKPQIKQVVAEPEIKVIELPETVTIKELAEKMKLQPSMLVKKLFLQGKIVTINQEVDFTTAEEIALEFDVICEKEVKIDVIEELLREEEEDENKMVPRPPVVCVMGHVDHGKTSLLDAIRSTNVIAKEAGGITQHIGAYMVEVDGQKITFLDTPGHEAFTAMRMRGAQATDIAILVVAADDGVMPQTVEAISHAKAAGIEIIVAVNKIDKPSANMERVKQELIEYELVAEDWGGSTIFVPVSAHTHEGIDTLLEMILLTAEMKELKSNPNRRARGLVIEAQLDKGRGPVATVLVQKGTLRVGDAIAAGACSGKVRAMIDDKGRRVKEAGPSTPVEILGLNDVPNAGEIFVSCENEKESRSFAATFISQGKEKLLEETKSKMSLDDLFSQIKAGNLKELNIIVKADVQGSVEAIKQSLTKLSNEEVVVKVIHGGVGAINESDMMLASTSNAIVIGFNVKPDATAKGIAEREHVDVRLYRVIYNAIEDVEAAMKGLLDPTFEEKVIGHAEVRQLFKASGVGTIAGSYVLDGKFQRGSNVRITRDGEQIFEGGLASLKRFKDDVKEVNTGYECGLVFEKFNDIQVGDLVEAYVMEEVAR